MTTRVLVALPDDLVADLDAIVGRRGHSAYIAKAVREKLRRNRLGRMLDDTAGVVAEEDIPDATPTPVVAGSTSSPMPDGSSCPVTLPPDPSFVPPPYAEPADGGEVWDGSPSPWTTLRIDRPYNARDFWKMCSWREVYSHVTEQHPL